MLRVSWPEYFIDPLQQLLSQSTSGDRPRSHRCLLWSMQAEHRICLHLRYFSPYFYCTAYSYCSCPQYTRGKKWRSKSVLAKIEVIKMYKFQYLMVWWGRVEWPFYVSQLTRCACKKFSPRLMCILTSKQVLRTPFAGQNRSFLRDNKFFHLFIWEIGDIYMLPVSCST